MALNIVELEYIDPPVAGAIFGVPIGTVDQAIEIWKWASDTTGFTCTITAKADGTETISIEGVTSEGVKATIGGEQWIVYNNGVFTLFATPADALAVYKPKGT